MTALIKMLFENINVTISAFRFLSSFHLFDKKIKENKTKQYRESRKKMEIPYHS
jgi:hypothetical protein